MGPAILLLIELQRSFMGVSWPGSAGDRSHPFSTYVKNYWNYISTPRVSRHVANRVNFILNVIYIFLFAVLIDRAEGCYSFTDIAKPKHSDQKNVYFCARDLVRSV